MGVLAHVLQIVGWWIAPLIIFLIKRESKFVSFHALQALLLQIAHMLSAAVFVVLWITMIFATIAHGTAKNGPPPLFFIFMPIIWLGWMGMWVVMLVIAIVYGVKAGRGEWAEYPVLGRLSRKILKIGPGGTAFES